MIPAHRVPELAVHPAAVARPAMDDRHVVYGWRPQAPRAAATMVRAQGAALWDEQGRRYVDFGAGQVNVNIGYGNARVAEAIRAQLDQVAYVAPYFATDVRNRLAAGVAQRLPGDLDHVFFTNSGAEAVENALKIAKAVTGRSKFLSAWQSYHGATAGASAVSGDRRRWLAEPGVFGVSHFHLPGQYRSAFGCDDDREREAALALATFEDLLEREGPDRIAGVILEPIVGTNGLYVPPRSFIRGVVGACRRHGVMFIADETMSGWGRSGRWFACEHFDVVPDILTTAKGITSGYVPLGAVALRPEVYRHFVSRPFVGGLTTEGHALACAAGVANLEVYEAEGLVERSAELGAWLLDRLHGLADRHPCVGDVRGRGLFACLELTSDRASRRPLSGVVPGTERLGAEIFADCLSRGLATLARGDLVFVTPPLVIERADLELGLEILDDVLTTVDRRLDAAAHPGTD